MKSSVEAAGDLGVAVEAAAGGDVAGFYLVPGAADDGAVAAGTDGVAAIAE